MPLVITLDLLVIASLCVSVFRRGFEETLPLAAFLVVLFPSESQIPIPGLFELTTQRIIVVVLLCLYLSSRKKKSPADLSSNKLPLRFLILAQIAWMTVATLNSFVFTVSLKTLLSQLLDYYLAFYIFGKSISSVKTVNKILTGIVAAMFICSVFGVIEARQGWSILSIFPAPTHPFGTDLGGENYRGVRIQSTFSHPILYGAALAMAIPMALYLISLAKTTKQKVFLWGAVLLMFMNIYKTGSRGPWLAAVMSLVLLVVLGRGLMRRYVIVIVLLAATTLIVRPGVWDTISSLYGATLDPESPQGESYQWRYALYDLAFQHLNHDLGRAVWGYGPESFSYLGWQGVFDVGEFKGKTVTFTSCDSSIAQLMIETGYVGLLIVALMLLTVGIITLRNCFRLPKPANNLCVVLFANICAFCFMMTNVAIWGWGQQTYMLWVIVAIAMIYPRLIRAETISDGKQTASSVELPSVKPSWA
jgi:hypothetical protein